jgi:hypothetical protein
MLLQHVCENTWNIQNKTLATLNHLLRHETETIKIFGNILLQHMQHPDKNDCNIRLEIDETF